MEMSDLQRYPSLKLYLLKYELDINVSVALLPFAYSQRKFRLTQCAFLLQKKKWRKSQKGTLLESEQFYWFFHIFDCRFRFKGFCYKSNIVIFEITVPLINQLILFSLVWSASLSKSAKKIRLSCQLLDEENEFNSTSCKLQSYQLDRAFNQLFILFSLLSADLLMKSGQKQKKAELLEFSTPK